jgi:hypothetical protein
MKQRSVPKSSSKDPLSIFFLQNGPSLRSLELNEFETSKISGGKLSISDRGILKKYVLVQEI